MPYFNSPTKGLHFMSDEDMARKTILVDDPNWQRPLISVTLQPGESVIQADNTDIHNNTTEPITVDNVFDMTAKCPQIAVPNPYFLLPDDAVEITDAEAAAIQNPPIPLATLQSNACDQIDAAAGQARAKYITVVDGQDAVYQMKLDEAKAYQAAANPVATDYPHLNAEATQTDTPIGDVASLVVNTYSQWVQVSARIEGYRRGGNVAVNKATDAAGVQAALEAALTNLAAC